MRIVPSLISMFIEITTVFVDNDGAPTKKEKSLINVNCIKCIMPKEGLILSNEDYKWAIWNKTLITFIGGGCIWSEHSYEEIKEWLQKALNKRF